MFGSVIAMNTRGTVTPERSKAARRAFSLIELVIVVVIIGIIAAIAVPKMSRGSQGASEGALGASLTVFRNAVDLYQTEHSVYPGLSPNNSEAEFVRQLTKYTDNNGASLSGGSVKDKDHPFGPYLRKIPPMPVGSKKGQTNIKIATSDSEVPGTTSEAWIYYPNTGELKANYPATELDSKDLAYSQY